MNSPLRILAITDLPWDPRLGAARVLIELADEWRQAGHTVEKFCLTDAFPKPAARPALSSLRQTLFPDRAAAYVRRNAGRFDLIDSLVGALPFSKSSLQFHGLLVARSIGSYKLYERFNRFARERWPDHPKGRFAGRLFHAWQASKLKKNAEGSVRYCDLLNLPNESEEQGLGEGSATSKPVFVQPYGLSESCRGALEKAAPSSELRHREKEICFIGTWSLRKGARDWPEIIRRIWDRIPEARFTFLGTMCETRSILNELGQHSMERIRCVPSYNPAELPALLARGTIGLFPSYIEGFGLGILEQLVSGIPVVAYDVPGPRQILEPLRSFLLTPEGDPAALTEHAIKIMEMDLPGYGELAGKCKAIGDGYRWNKIASATIQRYREELKRCQK